METKPDSSKRKPVARKLKFPLGAVRVTRGVAQSLDPSDVAEALTRHARGDWGEVGEEDWKENELSVREGFRLLSAYNAKDGTRFWVITEADRSSTTVLLPEEY